MRKDIWETAFDQSVIDLQNMEWTQELEPEHRKSKRWFTETMTLLRSVQALVGINRASTEMVHLAERIKAGRTVEEWEDINPKSWSSREGNPY